MSVIPAPDPPWVPELPPVMPWSWVDITGASKYGMKLYGRGPYGRYRAPPGIWVPEAAPSPWTPAPTPMPWSGVRV
jgi:hypothetical protein